MKFDTRYQPSNVPESLAIVKANSLYKALKGWTKSKEVEALLKGVNRNGFIAIYNAFGKREPAGILPSIGNKNNLDLITYLKEDLSEGDLTKIRRMIGAEGLF